MKTEYKKIHHGIHTFQLTCPVGFENFIALKQYCIESGKKYYSYTEYLTDIDIYELFNENGVNIELKCYSHPNKRMNLFYMYIRVNPSRILYKKWETRIFKATEENTRALENSLNRAIKTLPHFDKKLSEFNVSRCDLCTDIYFSNSTMVENYIKLCRARDTPPHFEAFTLYSDSGHRNILPNDSIKLKRLSYNISIYNKQAQMKNNRKVYSEKAIKSAGGILRVEVQLSSTKLGSAVSKLLKKSCSFSDKILALSAVQQDICHTIISRTFLSGQHLTLSFAINILNGRNGRILLTEQVGFLLQQTAKFRSLEKGLAEVQKTYPESDSKSLLRILEELNINPVCLPDQWLGKEATIPSIAVLLSK